MMVTDRVTRYVLVCALRVPVFGGVDLVNVQKFGGMDGAVTVGMGNHRHDNNAEKQPN